MGQLDGKIAIITGAGTGIGKGIARAFAREGATLVIASGTRQTCSVRPTSCALMVPLSRSCRRT